MRCKKGGLWFALAIMLFIFIAISSCSMLSEALGSVNLVISDSKKSGGSTKPPKGREDLTVKEEPEKPKEEAPKEQPAEEKEEEAVAEEPVQGKEVAKTEEAEDLSDTTTDEPTQEETAQEEAAASSETALAEEDNSEKTEETETEELEPQKPEEEAPEIAKAEKGEKPKPEKKPKETPDKKPETKPEKKPVAPESKPEREEETEEVPESTPEVHMFRPLFAQAFYFGGFYAGDDTFKETQGVVWRIESKTKGERKTFTVEKALLKVNPDGSKWWYLRHASREGDFQYEVLADRENSPRVIRFKDRDGNNRKYSFSGPEGGDLNFSEGGPAYRFKNENEYARYKEGKRTINIGAGKFKTDYLRVTLMDRGVDRVYQWWITAKVPGTLAKFIWEDKSTKTTTTGELMSVKMGYTTRFGSY